MHNTSYEPVSHDLKLGKRVLARNPTPPITQISYIMLYPGDSSSEHSHVDYVEVFYCIKGDAEFSVQGKTLSIRKGHLLFVEPGEMHAIQKVNEETELLYFHVTEKAQG